MSSSFSLDSSTLLPILLILGPIIWYFLTQQNKTTENPAEIGAVKSNDEKPTNSGVSASSLFGSAGKEKKLPAPKDTPITPEELKKHDGSDNSLPVYVAVKGKVFDVSESRETYAPGGGYHVFSGVDGSRALALSSIKKSDISHDYSDLPEEKVKILEDWFKFFTRKYPIVGVVKRD